MNDKLEQLAKSYAARKKAIEEFKVKHSKVFTKLDALMTELEEVEVKLKDAARKRAEAGQTVVLVNTPEVKVSVVGPQKAVEYDPTVAVAVWPMDVFKEVSYTAIDHKLVEQHINDGWLDKATAAKAEKPRENLTPRVTIEVR